MKSIFSKYKGSIKANILLVAVWGAVIVTGFLALGAIVGNIEGLIVFGYTAVHIFQHRKQIMLRFGIKINSRKQAENERQKNNRAVKAITAIVFHILLHMVSIHLAVAYTLFHIVQHRREIAPLPKRLLFRNNRIRRHSLQSFQLVRSAQPVQSAA